MPLRRRAVRSREGRSGRSRAHQQGQIEAATAAHYARSYDMWGGWRRDVCDGFGQGRSRAYLRHRCAGQQEVPWIRALLLCRSTWIGLAVVIVLALVSFGS